MLSAPSATRTAPPQRELPLSRAALWHLALGAATLLVCLRFPPLWAYISRLPLALALCALGVGVGLLPGKAKWAALARGVGIALLWLVLVWCVLSQLAPILQAPGRTVGERLPLVSLGALVWFWLRFPGAWQRRTVLALLLPTTLGLGVVGVASPARMRNFAPSYMAVDSHGTLYVADRTEPILRVFRPDGTEEAKLLPGVGGATGRKGSGFRPTGPLNDPDQLGIGKALKGGVVWREPWPNGFEDFIWCGLAVGAHDRLYIPDQYNGFLLRFAPDGNMEARTPLPQLLRVGSKNCFAANANAEYLSDAGGLVFQFDTSGGEVSHWTMPGPIVGGISLSPDGQWLYAMGQGVLYQYDLRAKTTMTWPLPIALGNTAPTYGRFVALTDGRVLLANVATQRLEIYCAGGHLCGTIGAPGQLPGQLEKINGLAVDAAGNIYVADSGNDAVQRFTPSGQVTTLYWSVYEHEQEAEPLPTPTS